MHRNRSGKRHGAGNGNCGDLGTHGTYGYLGGRVDVVGRFMKANPTFGEVRRETSVLEKTEAEPPKTSE